jgi:DNA-binding GntR family transcriptional regulator
VPKAHSHYQDIADRIKARIEAGEWVAGDKLPTLDVFAKQYRHNRNTVNRALDVLEVEGYVLKTQGSGTFVRWGARRPRRKRGDVVKRNMVSLGYSFPSASGQEQWMRHGEATSERVKLTDERIADLLKVKPGTKVLRRHRVTGPHGEAPFQINISWIHPRVANLAENVNANPAAGEWLYRIEVGGHWPIGWREIHRARMPSKDEAALLQIPTSLPVIEIVRVGLSGQDGEPVEVTEYIIASDRVETEHVLQRDEEAQQPWPEDAGNQRDSSG